MNFRFSRLFVLGFSAAPALLAATLELQLTVPAALSGPAPIPLSVAADAALFPAGPARHFRLVSTTTGQAGDTGPGAAQFEPAMPGAAQGTLWVLIPGSPAGPRRYRLVALASEPMLTIKADPSRQYYDIAEGNRPVFRYNHGSVPPPAGIATNYARGDYIMPLFGTGGELLTDDYPPDHPHHRGLGWSWPVTRWGDEVRDIWAVSGVWARPLALRRAERGSVCATLEASSVWRWGDTNAIVREDLLIRTFQAAAGHRLIDIEVRLTALADRVAIGGRPHGGYGGFGLRAQPAQARRITRFTDLPEVAPRRSWLDYSGEFKGGAGVSGLALFECVSNPLYPNELKEYPDLNYVMPAFPGEREVPLRQDVPLVLRHRVWLHPGTADAAALEATWRAYATPPTAKILSKD